MQTTTQQATLSMSRLDSLACMQSRRSLLSSQDESAVRRSLEEVKNDSRQRNHAIASAREDYSEASPLQVVVDHQTGQLCECLLRLM